MPFIENLSAKRNFYLMLSPPDGQDIATEAGLTPATDEVREYEEKDVLRRWSLLTSMGVIESIEESSEWMSEIMVREEMLPDEEDLSDGSDFLIRINNDDPDSDDYATFEPVEHEEIIKMFKDIKESAYGTFMGCIVSAVSKLIDEDLLQICEEE